MVPPYSLFQSHALSKNLSLPKSSLLVPSSLSLATILASVAMAAWSTPGIHKVLKPFNFLYLINYNTTLILFQVLNNITVKKFTKTL